MKKAGAKGFDAYAHHPYYGAPRETPSTPPPPGIHGNAPTAITLGNINLLISEVTRLYGNKRIWITEYGYQTNPPDRIFGVSWAKQAQLPDAGVRDREAEPAHRHVPLVPAPRRARGSNDGWQSGLLTASGAKKPVVRGVPEAARLAGAPASASRRCARGLPRARPPARSPAPRARCGDVRPRVAHVAGPERQVLLLDRLPERGADRVRQLVDARLPAGGDVEDGAGRAVARRPRAGSPRRRSST